MRKLVLLLFSIVLMGAAFAFGQNDPAQNDSSYKLGLQQIEQKKFADAVMSLSQTLEKYPNSAQALLNRGTAWQRQGKFEAAFADYNSALRINPKYVDALESRGYIYNYILKKYDLALADYNRVIELNPRSSGVYLIRGDIYESLKNYEAALADYDRALELDSQSAATLSRRGGLHYKMKNLGQARADFERAAALEPNNAKYKNYAVNLAAGRSPYTVNPGAEMPSDAELERTRKLYETPEAQQKLKQTGDGVQNSLAEFDASYKRGLEEINQKKYAEAVASFSQTLKAYPNFDAAWFNRGKAYMFQKNIEQAVADYTQAIKLNPQNYRALNNRGMLRLEQNNPEAALADLNQAIKANPTYAPQLSNRGNIYISLKNYDLALADLNESIRLDPAIPEAYFNRSKIYFFQKNYEAAIDDATRAIRVNANYPNSYLVRGAALFESKKSDLGKSDFEKVLTIYPTNATAKDYLAKINVSAESEIEQFINKMGSGLTEEEKRKADQQAKELAKLVTSNSEVDKKAVDAFMSAKSLGDEFYAMTQLSVTNQDYRKKSDVFQKDYQAATRAQRSELLRDQINAAQKALDEVVKTESSYQKFTAGQQKNIAAYKDYYTKYLAALNNLKSTNDAALAAANPGNNSAEKSAGDEASAMVRLSTAYQAYRKKAAVSANLSSDRNDPKRRELLSDLINSAQKALDELVETESRYRNFTADQQKTIRSYKNYYESTKIAYEALNDSGLGNTDIDEYVDDAPPPSSLQMVPILAEGQSVKLKLQAMQEEFKKTIDKNKRIELLESLKAACQTALANIGKAQKARTDYTADDKQKMTSLTNTYNAIIKQADGNLARLRQ